eukprot:360512-Chlamydomonas_euryale.AAC.1
MRCDGCVLRAERVMKGGAGVGTALDWSFWTWPQSCLLAARCEGIGSEPLDLAFCLPCHWHLLTVC